MLVFFFCGFGGFYLRLRNVGKIFQLVQRGAVSRYAARHRRQLLCRQRKISRDFIEIFLLNKFIAGTECGNVNRGKLLFHRKVFVRGKRPCRGFSEDATIAEMLVFTPLTLLL